MRVGIVITSRGICLLVIGQVHELDEQTTVWKFLDHQLMLLAVPFKRNITLHWFIENGAKDIWHLHDLWGFIASVRGGDAELFSYRIPLPGRKRSTRLPCVIPHTDPHA